MTLLIILTRYVDDLLLFGRSLTEAREMLELLAQELAAAGLEMNGAKTKVLTTDLHSSGAGPHSWSISLEHLSKWFEVPTPTNTLEESFQETSATGASAIWTTGWLVLG